MNTYRKFFRGFAVFCLVILPGLTALQAQPDPPVFRAALEASGRSVSVEAPGFDSFSFVFAATVEIDGVRHELLSTEGTCAGVLTCPPEWGLERASAGVGSVIVFPDKGVELLFRMGDAAGLPAVLAHVGVRSLGKQRVRLVALTPIKASLRTQGDPVKWLLTGFYPAIHVLVNLNELGAGNDVFERGGFYRSDGAGFLFGPVGRPVAYVGGRFKTTESNTLTMDLIADMSGVPVEAGQIRWGQEVVVLMEPPRTALPRWAGWVAASHAAPSTIRPLAGWSSWYLFGKAVTGRDVLDVVDVVGSQKSRLVPDVIEIDTGYTPEKFPEGLAFYAKRIADAGVMPGLRVELNGTTNGLALIRQALDDGFRYLKFSGIEYLPVVPAAPKLTSFENSRAQFARIRQLAGPAVYLLCCDGYADRSAVGFVDASRTGRETKRNEVRSAMDDVLRSYMLGGRWFALDNDNYYMGTDIANISAIAGGWPLVRTWMSMVGLSCGAAITSDPWHWESFKAYLRNVEVMMPPAREQTEVLDLCTARAWPRLVGHVRRPWGDFCVALLWNPAATEQRVDLDFATAGLSPDRRYAVWSFWDNRFLGVAQGAWTTPALAASASQHLRFTDLDRTPDRPVVIGSSLHIYCGAAEISGVKARRDGLTIDLTDAGARSGDLFIYSRYQPVWLNAEGCVVSEIARAGENVWRIGVADRRCGERQRIELAVLLPIMRQAWFWALCMIAGCSLVFGAWRYVVWSQMQLKVARLEQQTARQQERVRIARDLHDDLGASLAQISMLGILTQKMDASDPLHDSRLAEIATLARENAQKLDELVWAVNPARDSLEHLVEYLIKFSECYLSAAGVRFRVDVPGEMLPLALDSVFRHHLFLATREAIHNAVRHGHPSTVTLRVTLSDGRLEVTVSDNGSGFDAEAALAGGRGVSNIRERLAQIGGELRITSQPGQGCRVTFILPLNRLETLS